MREEVREAMARLTPEGGAIDESGIAEALESLPLLNGVIHETLRLYPTIPQTARQANIDTVISGQLIPKGTRLLVSIWSLNRHAAIWGSDSLQFVPERWINPDGKPNSTGGSKSNYDFVTFLHGPRSCIGQKFALAELACMLAAFVGRYKFEMTYPDEEIIVKGGITARPKNGMRLNVEVIDW